LLDLVLFLFGPDGHSFQPWACHRFENRSYDHFLFGSRGRLTLELEVTLLSWRNTFTLDIYGELGSIHVNGLCKWGPCTLTFRKRVLPSGRPPEQAQTLENPDPTWVHEYEYFKQLCRSGGTNLANDLWIQHALDKVSQQTTGGLAA
jgi:scyllo-inositol 2-dehydrogenase (NADP+)